MQRNKLLSKLENKYYYGISRTFWHILIAIASILTVVALLITIYTYIPTVEDKIDEPVYPSKQTYPNSKPVKVEEINALLPKEKQVKPLLIQEVEEEEAEITSAPVIQTKTDGIDPVALAKFEEELIKLKTIVSPENNNAFWNGSGTYVITDKRRYQRTKSDQYRKFITITSPFREVFIRNTDYNDSFPSYDEKSQLLNAINSFLANIPLDKRAEFALLISNLKNGSIEKTVETIRTLGGVLEHIDEKELDKAYDRLFKFAKRNPNDGNKVLKYLESNINKFQNDQRIDAIQVLIREFSPRYDGMVKGFTNSTDDFFKIINQIPDNQQALALKKYYLLYHTKNANMDRQIQQIELAHQQQIAQLQRKYQEDLAQAKINYNNKKAEKSTLRWSSIRGFAIALGTILIISIILLLLAMIRNVNRLAQAMLENTKNTKQ